MNIVEMLSEAVRQKAADIFLIPGMPFSYKISGRIESIGENKIFPEEMDKIIAQIYEIAGNRSMERVLLHGDDDFSLQSHLYPVFVPVCSGREVRWQQLFVS